MKQYISKPAIFFVLTAVLNVTSEVKADTTFWQGVGGSSTDVSSTIYGNWTSAANWTNGIGIDNTLDVIIDEVTENGGRVLMNPNADSYTDNEIWVAFAPAPSKMGSLTLNGGTLQHTDGSSTHKTSRIGDGGAGVLTQTGGVWYMNSGELRIGNNNNNGGIGLYDISGGTFSTSGGLRPGGNVMINRNKLPTSGTTRGEFRIRGTAVIDMGIADTNAAALGFGPGAGNPGSSWLTVVGPDATINIDSVMMVNATPQANTSVIRFSFDENGVSTIQLTGDFVYDGTNSASAVLSGGILDVDYNGTVEPADGQTYDLIVGDLILNDGSFSLNPKDAANWSLTTVGTGLLGDGQQDVLRLTFLGGPIIGTRLVGYWPFHHNTSPQPDFSGFNNHATPNSGASWVLDTGRSSGVMEFDGNDSFLEAADSDSLSLTGDLTIAAWVNPTDYSGFRSIVGKTDGNQPASYDLYLNSGGGNASFFAGSPGSIAGVSSLTTVPAGEWHHFAVTMQDGDVVCYLDGAPDGSGMIQNALLDSVHPLLIGNRGDLFTDFLGRMDDVAIFDGALSQLEIGTIMAGDFSSFGALPEDFSITAFSRSGNFVNLTWMSRPGLEYIVKYSEDLVTWIGDIADSVPAGAGDTTSGSYDLSDFDLENKAVLYIRVEIEN